MSFIRTVIALSGAALINAGAIAAQPSPSTKAEADEHAGHHPANAASAPSPTAPHARAAQQDLMKTMQDMHDKMMNAKTAQERQALMADHMKAIQGGMQMMKGMGAKPMASMGGMGDPKATPADMAQRQQLMESRMETMQLMMEMMMQRMPASGPARD
jgi:hypothetical protein